MLTTNYLSYSTLLGTWRYICTEQKQARKFLWLLPPLTEYPENPLETNRNHVGFLPPAYVVRREGNFFSLSTVEGVPPVLVLAGVPPSPARTNIGCTPTPQPGQGVTSSPLRTGYAAGGTPLVLTREGSLVYGMMQLLYMSEFLRVNLTASRTKTIGCAVTVLIWIGVKNFAETSESTSSRGNC